MNASASQSRYQVRFDFAVRGSAAITHGAHVLVWCDALPTGAGVPPFAGAVLVGTTGNAAATAEWILALQSSLADRSIVAVVAAGTDDDGFAVEDFLAAGAVIDALATIGIDSVSPEAASACAAYVGLRTANLHLISASMTGQKISAEARAAAQEISMMPTVSVLQKFSGAN